MKERDELRWYLALALLLLLLSGVLYLFHFLVFRDVRHIFIYMVGDLAFLPIEVLLVAVIVHRVLEMGEKRRRVEKLNTIIGVFFGRMGNELLALLARCDAERKRLEEKICLGEDWDEDDFLEAFRTVAQVGGTLFCTDETARQLRDFFVPWEDFLVTLLENPSLMEHEEFTDLLWAVFHLAEELRYRDMADRLPPSDLEHLAGDMNRVYRLLAREWLRYARHLKKNYPYLYSLLVRTNPFNPSSCAVVGGGRYPASPDL